MLSHVYKKIHIITKDVIGLQLGNIMVAQVDTKKLRLNIIGFNNTLTNNDDNKDNNILAIASLASDARNAGKGWDVGLGNRHCLLPQALAMGAAAAPATRNGTKDVLRRPSLIAAAPAQHAAKVCCPVFLIIAPLQNGRAQVHPAGHLSCGNTSSANHGSDSALALLHSAPLRPIAIAVIIFPATGVRGQSHHPGKPVQADGVVDQVDPAHTHQVHQGAPCNGATTVVTAIVCQGGQRPLHAC
jgi:hypothetical protein